MKFKPGPHPVSEKDLTQLAQPRNGAPPRYFGCSHYNTCLDLAAALAWETFSCCGCSGEVDPTLVWRARHAQKKDLFAKELCSVPQPPCAQGGKASHAHTRLNAPLFKQSKFGN